MRIHPFCKKRFEIDHKKLGLRTADILIKVSKGDCEKVANEIVKQHSKNVVEISLRIGDPNINLVARIVYKDNEEIYELMRTVNRIEYIENFLWCEIVKHVIKNEDRFIDSLISNFTGK